MILLQFYRARVQTISGLCVTAAFASLQYVPVALATTPATWTNGAGTTLYNNPGNWSPNVVPNGDYAVTVGTPSPTIMNLNVSLTSLDVTAGGSFNLTNGNSLTLTQARTMTLAGTILLNPEGSAGTTTLTLPQFDLTLVGGGDIQLNSASSSIVGGAFVNLPAGMSIHGVGSINATVQNSGSIIADQAGGTLTLLKSPGNSGVIKATNGGTIALAFNNSLGGHLVADNGTFRVSDTVLLRNATLDSSNGGEYDFLGIGTGATLETSTNNGTSVIKDGANVRINATLTNNGTINIAGGSGNTPTGFTSNFDVSLLGTGQIVMQSQSSSTISTGSAFLTNGASHTIRGTGSLAVSTLFNDGTINADQAGGTLAANGTIANSATGTVSVSNGATMTVVSLSNSGTINVAGGGAFSAPTFPANYGTLRLGAGGGSGTATFAGGLTVSASNDATPKAGSLVGTGLVNANVTVTSNAGMGGTINPGTATAAGQLTINGTLTAAAGGHLAFDIGGTTAGTTFDVLSDSAATFGGTIDVRLLGAFRPAAADSFVILTSAAANTGSFANVLSGQRLTTADGLGSFLVTYPAGGTTLTLSNFALVPEPTTLAATLGVFGLLGRRRRSQCGRQRKSDQ